MNLCSEKGSKPSIDNLKGTWWQNFLYQIFYVLKYLQSHTPHSIALSVARYFGIILFIKSKHLRKCYTWNKMCPSSNYQLVHALFVSTQQTYTTIILGWLNEREVEQIFLYETLQKGMFCQGRVIFKIHALLYNSKLKYQIFHPRLTMSFKIYTEIVLHLHTQYKIKIKYALCCHKSRCLLLHHLQEVANRQTFLSYRSLKPLPCKD